MQVYINSSKTLFSTSLLSSQITQIRFIYEKVKVKRKEELNTC